MKKHFFESAREIDLSYRKGLDRRSQHLMTGRLLLFFAAIFAAAAGYDQQLPALYALAAGFPPERMAATGFGEYRPVAAGDAPEARAQNRRIELKLTER